MFFEQYFSTMMRIIEKNGLKRNKQLFFNILQITYSIPCNTTKQSPKQERRSFLMKDSLDFNKIRVSSNPISVKMSVTTLSPQPSAIPNQ